MKWRKDKPTNSGEYFARLVHEEEPHVIEKDTCEYYSGKGWLIGMGWSIVEWLDETEDWVSVEVPPEIQPELTRCSKDVLCADGIEQYVAFYDHKDGSWWLTAHGKTEVYPESWQPLPALPSPPTSLIK